MGREGGLEEKARKRGRDTERKGKGKKIEGMTEVSEMRV